MTLNRDFVKRFCVNPGEKVKIIRKFIFSFFLSCMIGQFPVFSVLVVPPMPSSFYGQVKVNGQNVPVGTIVQAFINGTAYAETRSLTYQGNSVYSLNVPGDQAETASIEGGVEGDTVQFRVGGIFAGQSGVWHSGVNKEINLTASGTIGTASPSLTPTNASTQTPIPSQTPVPTVAQVTATSGNQNPTGTPSHSLQIQSPQRTQTGLQPSATLIKTLVVIPNTIPNNYRYCKPDRIQNCRPST